MRMFGEKFQRFKITAKDGKKITLKIPPPSNLESFFIFSLHKSGSTLINNMFIDVCKHLKLSFIDIEGSLFKKGYMPGHINGNISHLFFERGYAYLGFRSFWIDQSFDATRNKCILLIRDPRDALVSHYFSYLYSHGIPASGPISKTMSKNRDQLVATDINAYVLHPQFINIFKNGFAMYETFLSSKTTRVYRYEDVIYQKFEWIADMLEYLGLDLDSDLISSIARKHDIHPLREDPLKHVRQVTPGNFRKHLTEETIEKLNFQLSKIIIRYGYDRIREFRLGEGSNDKS